MDPPPPPPPSSLSSFVLIWTCRSEGTYPYMCTLDHCNNYIGSALAHHGFCMSSIYYSLPWETTILWTSVYMFQVGLTPPWIQEQVHRQALIHLFITSTHQNDWSRNKYLIQICPKKHNPGTSFETIRKEKAFGATLLEDEAWSFLGLCCPED